jgi:CheY-like chemotaxis protein
VDTDTALIIDDNLSNRQIFRTILECNGYQVTDTGDPAAGINFLANSTYTLLLLDLQMPRITGEYILNQIRPNPRHDDMTIIIVTANPHMTTDNAQNKADYVFQKPINVSEFTQFTKRFTHADANA